MNTNSPSIWGYFEQTFDAVHSLYGLPGYALVLLTCIIVGYIMKIMKWFPNEKIPAVVIAWGIVFNLLSADTRDASVPVRLYIVKNLLIGMIIGFIAWLIHNRWLSRIENSIPLLKNFLPSTGNTEVFKKDTGS